MIRLIWLYVSLMSVNSTIRYICDTQHLNIICIISYFNIFPFFRALFPLQHICYYLNLPTLYRWTIPMSIIWYLKYICSSNDLWTATIHGCHLIKLHTLPTIRANIVSSWSTDTKVSAINWYSYYRYFVYFTENIFRTTQGDYFYSPTLR